MKLLWRIQFIGLGRNCLVVQLQIKVALKLELSKVEELMCFRKNFDIHTGKYFDIMLFVFNSDVFSFLIDSAHPRSPSLHPSIYLPTPEQQIGCVSLLSRKSWRTAKDCIMFLE